MVAGQPISLSRRFSENGATHRDHRRQEVVRQINDPVGIKAKVSEKKCNFSNGGRNVAGAHSNDQEELNHLQNKEEDLKRRNEISKEKIAARRGINAQLKIELENKKQLHNLEQEEMAYETGEIIAN